MTFDPFKVTDYANWGKLVKAWSLGKIPLPQSLAEFKEQCREHKVGEHLPHTIKAVQFVQSNVETLLIRLPTASMIEAAEKEIESGEVYALPKFYSRDAFGGAPEKVADGKRLEFQAERIGDYTIGNCM